MNKANTFRASPRALARLAKALAHPARVQILQFLARRETCFCGQIVDELPLAQSTVSQHLAELKRAALIQGTIDGAKTCYCLRPETVVHARALFDELLTSLEQAHAGLAGTCRPASRRRRR